MCTTGGMELLSSGKAEKIFSVTEWRDNGLRREAVVKIFLPPFGCDLVRPPYVVIDSNLFSMTLSFYFREIL